MPTPPDQSLHDPADDQRAADALARMRRVNPRANPEAALPDVPPDCIPRHIAIIMDGNGRWAQQRGLPRIMGHRNGASAVRRVVEACSTLGVEVLTLYSFSIENWTRPETEINALMELCVAYCQGERDELVRAGIRVRIIGRTAGLPDRVVEALRSLEDATRDIVGPTLCLAINYGSRPEITDAARAIARKVAAGTLDPDAIDEHTIADHLDTAGLPDPDLLIRTAGEMRLSNFLLWQVSYAELFVTSTLWPDFAESDLHEAIRSYAARSRRFGGLDQHAAQPSAAP